jgi:hypothetical protein
VEKHLRFTFFAFQLFREEEKSENVKAGKKMNFSSKKVFFSKSDPSHSQSFDVQGALKHI